MDEGNKDSAPRLEDAPDWVQDVKVAYDIVQRTSKDAPEDIFRKTTALNQEVHKNFEEYIKARLAYLPSHILIEDFRGEMHKYRLKRGNRTTISEHSAHPYRLYFLPETMEIVSIELESDLYTSKAVEPLRSSIRGRLPEVEDFTGFDALRTKLEKIKTREPKDVWDKNDPTEYRGKDEFRKVEPSSQERFRNFWNGVEMQRKIVEVVDSIVSPDTNGQTKDTKRNFEETMHALQEEGEKLEADWADQIKLRLMNLTDSVKRHFGKNYYEKYINIGGHDNSSDSGEYYFYSPREGKLVRGRLKKKLMAKSVEEIREATPEEWIILADHIAFKLTSEGSVGDFQRKYWKYR